MITLKNIWKIYDTGKIKVDALRGVDLTIEEGEFVSIIGASGSGKSTMMNILGCLDRPTKGKYHLHENSVDTFDEDQLAKIRNKNVGFVFQTFNLVPRVTAFHNVELPLIYGKYKAKERKTKVNNALAKVGLSDRMNHKPNELSGGQKQRVAIARALVNNPSIILADEPTGNLDEQNTEIILDLLFELRETEQVTLVLITHEKEIANRCDTLYSLQSGVLEKEN